MWMLPYNNHFNDKHGVTRRLMAEFIQGRSSLKPGQNKKGQKCFQLHRFLNTFYSQQLRKSIQKGAAGKFFGPSYFVTALAILKMY